MVGGWLRLELGEERHGLNVVVKGRFHPRDTSELLVETSVQYVVLPQSPHVDRSLPTKMFDSVSAGRTLIGNAGILMSEWIETNRWGGCVAPGAVKALSRFLGEARREYQPVADRMALPPTWPDQGARLRQVDPELLSR